MDDSRIKSLLQPAAYPDPAADVELIQTHVSWIFLAGEFAYKIKKPVNFGFLDFSTLDRRLFYCQEELRLNRRLCPQIYLDVVKVRATPGGAAFHGQGAVIDYAVKMIRLPAERMADRLLAEGELTAAEVKRIARAIAAFHRRALTGGEIDSYGSLETIRQNWEENFQQAAAFKDSTLSGQDLGLIREWVERFMTLNSELFSKRVAGGFIRECDGDLHLENICLTDRVCIFDCIEFNSRFRCSDTTADIAFLVMDLEFHGRRDLAEIFLAEYTAASSDSGVMNLVGFYAVYRAFVRGKVESFRLKDPGIPLEEKQAAKERAVSYFSLARGYILRERLPPALVAVCGLTGSGKSTLAAALSRDLGLELLSSDRIRKELANVPLCRNSADDYGAGLYSRGASAATYRELIARAASSLSAGKGVIVDATCQKRESRERLRRIAAEHGAPLYLIVVESAEEVIRQRLAERVRQGGSISDGRWEIYLRQREQFEPFTEGEGERLTVDGSAALHDTAVMVLGFMGLIPPLPDKKIAAVAKP